MGKAFQATAYKAVREEYGKYFEALEKHPRLLVGQEVPSPTGEGMERLRDSNDAKEWQEAVKSILVQEINERSRTSMDQNRQMLETVHASIDLFRKNTDLIPGTKTFNRELADKFAAMAKPYEVRSDGKLQGYSIPVQPLIDQLRQQAQAKPAPKTPPPAEKSRLSKAQNEPPQAAVTTKAGSRAGEREDFSTLFGTIGLPDLRI